MDGLSAGASIIAVVEISAKVISLCLQYSAAVKNARDDIEQLQQKIKAIEAVLGRLSRLWDDDRVPASHELAASLKGCFGQLHKLEQDLKPGKRQKAMSRLGARALMWPLKSKETREAISKLESYEQTFALSLQVDQTVLISGLDEKIDLSKLPVVEAASFDSHSEEHNATCLALTRVEIREEILAWATRRDNKHIFWLSGMAGTGKSTIARTMAKSLADRNQLGATFFFKKGEGDRGNASKLFTTIAAQLMTHIPRMKPGIKKALDADPSIAGKKLNDQFVKLILEPLSQAPTPGVKGANFVVVVDALDECDREQDMKEILRLWTQAKELDTVHLRVLVTSRPELPIRLGFRRMSDGVYQDLVLHEVAPEIIERDMTLFFEHELAKIGEERQLDPPWPIEGSMETLVGMAVPLFIFAATVCRFLAEATHSPRARLKDILTYNAEDLSQQDMTYLPILDQLFGGSGKSAEKASANFREVVGPIVILEAPLSILALAVLLDLPAEDIRCRLDSLHSVLHIPANEQLPIRLLHKSFHDFLLDPGKRGKSPYWIDEKETHRILAEKCLQVMLGPRGLRRNICELPNAGPLDGEIDRGMLDKNLGPEVRYACRYWVEHLRKCEWRIDDHDLVHRFLQTAFLYWLEALSLTRETIRSISMINTLQTLAYPARSPTASAFLRDAKRFALWIRPILEDAPLQLYFSALIFAPQNCMIRTTFTDHSPSWVSRLSKWQDEWDPLLQTFEGHTGRVVAVKFSPSGLIVASGSEDHTIRLWDVETGLCSSVLSGHTSSAYDLCFSRDGSLLVSASSDRLRRLWDVRTGLCLNILEEYTDHSIAGTFSPDDTLLASPSHDDIKLWNITAMETEHTTLKGHSHEVKDLSFSPNGDLLASGSSDGTVRVWDVATQRCIKMFDDHWKGYRGTQNTIVYFSPDSRLSMWMPGDRTFDVWDSRSDSYRRTATGQSAHEADIFAVDFSPDGRKAAALSYDEGLYLLDLTSEPRFYTWDRGSSDFTFVKYSPIGTHVATANDHEIRLWDLEAGTLRMTLQSPGSMATFYRNTIGFSPDGMLLIWGSGDGNVHVWDMTTTTPRRNETKGHGNAIEAMNCSLDGRLIVTGSRDDTIRVWDVTKGVCRNVLRGDTGLAVSAICISPDNSTIMFGQHCGRIQFWDAVMGPRHKVGEINRSSITDVKFSPDGTSAASVTDNGELQLWDVLTGSCINGFGSRTVEAFSFSLDNTSMIAFGTRGSFQTWIPDTGSSWLSPKLAWDWITAVAASPDGSLLALASGWGMIRLWDAVTWSFLGALRDDVGCVNAMSFSPDGRHLKTNRGPIPLPPTKFDTIKDSKQAPLSIFVGEKWVRLAGRPVLWLPPGYRPKKCVAVVDDVICLGLVSGQMAFLKIHTELLPDLSMEGSRAWEWDPDVDSKMASESDAESSLIMAWASDSASEASQAWRSEDDSDVSRDWQSDDSGVGQGWRFGEHSDVSEA